MKRFGVGCCDPRTLQTTEQLPATLRLCSSWEDKARQLLGSWGATSAEFISQRRSDQVDTQVVVADAPTTVFVFFRG